MAFWLSSGSDIKSGLYRYNYHSDVAVSVYIYISSGTNTIQNIPLYYWCWPILGTEKREIEFVCPGARINTMEAEYHLAAAVTERRHFGGRRGKDVAIFCLILHACAGCVLK